MPAGARFDLRRVTRRGVAGTLAVLAALAFLTTGLLQTRVETGVDSFLPSSDPSLQRFDELSASFGGDPVVVLIEGRTPHGLLAPDVLPRMLDLEGRLARLPDVAAVYGPATTLNQIAGQAQTVLLDLLGRRDGLQKGAHDRAVAAGRSEAEATAVATAAVADFDARYGPMIVQGMPTGLPTLRNPKLVENVIYNTDGQPRPRWQYLVPDANSVAVLVRPRAALDQAGTERLVAAVGSQVASAGLPTSRTTVSGVPAIVAGLGEEISRQVPLVGAAAVLVIGLCLWFSRWTARRRRRLVPLAITLAATALTIATLGWAGHPVSLGVVAFLPVLVGLGSYYPTYMARRANPRTVLVVAAGSALSFATLALSPLPFVRDLGVTLAIGIGFAVGLSWLLVRRSDPADDPAAAAVPRPVRAPLLTRRQRLATAGAVAALSLGGWALLPTMPLTSDVETLSAGLPAIADADHVQQVMGTSGELALTLSGPDVRSPRAWAWMAQAQRTIVTAHGDEMKPVLSPPGLLSFLGDAPTAEQIDGGLKLLPSYLTSSVLRPDGRMASLSYGVSLSDVSALQRLTTSVRAELPPPPPGYTAELSGLPTVAVRGYEMVSGDRYLASLAGVLAAGLVLAIGLRHRRDAARAVATGIVATGLELLVIAVLRLPLNPLTVALGSLTAAVGCEFAVMTADAVRRADRSVRSAVALAAATSGAGYAVLAVSGLDVLREFGLLLAGSVLLAWFAARLVVWAVPPTTAGPPAVTKTEERSPSLAGVAS